MAGGTWTTQKFESRVVLDGSQTPVTGHWPHWVFESRVVLDGSQTTCETKCGTEV